MEGNVVVGLRGMIGRSEGEKRERKRWRGGQLGGIGC
jgi:hypothetical protein